MRKRIIITATSLLLVIAVILGSVKLYRVHRAHQCGIVLAFDDYDAQNWEKYFVLFDKYDVKVTFFVNAYEPTDFCFNAIEKGHEIAFHTAGHAILTGLTEDEIYEQAIAPIETFREQGIELTTFAYPEGLYTQELNEQLLQYYNVLRGAYYCEIVGKHEMRHGFVESLSLDNINYSSDEAYKNRIDSILTELDRNTGAVVGLYSHAISDGSWCVTAERLEYLFQRAKEMGIQFYTYKELQHN